MPPFYPIFVCVCYKLTVENDCWRWGRGGEGGLAAQPVLVQQGDGGQLSKVLVGTYYLVSIYYNPDSGPGVKKSKQNFFSKNVNQIFL